MAVQRRHRHPDRWCDLAGGHARCQELSRGLDPLGRHDLLAPTYPACATRDDERGRRSLAHEVAWLCCQDWQTAECGCLSAPLRGPLAKVGWTCPRAPPAPG